MNRPPIICHHCGRDYAREFWLSGGSFEHPFMPGVTKLANHVVCPSCCRDTNPDAADAPRWVPSAPAPSGATAELVEPLAVLVTQSRKQCRTCGGEWDGLIFGPSATKGSPLPFGICDACADAEEARIAAMRVVPVVSATALPEMRRPRRVVGLDD